MDQRFQIKTCPVCLAQAVVQGEKFRITVLTESLLRLEYCEDGQFEDRPTQMVQNRAFPVPEFQVTEKDGWLELRTACLRLTYDGKVFSRNGLFIRMTRMNTYCNCWYYGDPIEDLGGTARTLDRADGAIPLESGLLSRTGYAVVDDSHSMVLTEDGWVEPRKEGIIDLYFFGYEHRYQECIRDFYQLSGKTPLLPRWAFGNWWSRYHRYTQEEYQKLIERFEQEKLPFSVAVIDMDWHVVDVPKDCGFGWTGYTWNRELFPDHKAFLQWLHEKHLKVTLNVHPADGIRYHEEMYPQVAEACGIDPASRQQVAFDVTDPHFMEVYFDLVHHPLEEDGVDFWWVDWQQGTATRIPGLDPLWMLNHYHYLDSCRRGNRAITFSRYAGLGSHRYPVGFSGDTVISWESLDFQPYFTATASNAGYGWWSHDIGGHMNGIKDPELMTRWVQLGVFSPINRLHSTDNPFNGKEPWNFGVQACGVIEDFLRLRHQMIPYLYSMNRLAHEAGQPLVRPMYWLEPEQPECYQVPNEYYFGTQLLAAPVTSKMDTVTQMGSVNAWIPEGLWFDFFSGRQYRGGRRMKLYRALEEMPVLVKAGGIVILQDGPVSNDTANPNSLEMRLYPGENGTFHLWEDGGDTAVDQPEQWAETVVDWNWEQGRLEVSAAQGNIVVLPEQRSWKLRFMNMQQTVVSVQNGKGQELQAEITEEESGWTVLLEGIPVEEKLVVVLDGQPQLIENNLAEQCYQILDRAQCEYDLKLAALRTIEKSGEKALAELSALELPRTLFEALCEVLQASA